MITDELLPDDEVIEQPSTGEDLEVSDHNTGAILYEIFETIILAILIWLAVNFVSRRYVVEGPSMEPNLHTGQFLIVSRLSYMEIGDRFQLGEPQHGDIIVFDYPGNPTDDYVKRVIGVPGDTVSIDDRGIVYINGTPIDEPYISPGQYSRRSNTWQVPEDNYFVLGDNRNHSSDSRDWGMLERRYIVGKAWFSYWPIDSLGFLPHYDFSSALNSP
ncbi:MAG: signal peptidase I [Anaerolineae bacterium]|nr:signal peptidase I [Anaerolineae bacterium]